MQHKREELVRSTVTRRELERLAQACVRRGFEASLRASRPAIIAEIKKASPSKGILASRFEPARTATQYAAGGAAAISVLTDGEFFQGSLADLEAARGAVNLPVLRKDFTISEYHVVEAAAHGADAILLIAAILTEAQLRDFRLLADEFGMAALVEVHDAREADSALRSGARIIGVNNRDLQTFEVRLETSIELGAKIPNDVLKVSESGIRGAADIAMLSSAGFSAFLVGEHLMTSGDPSEELRKLRCS